MNIGIIDIGWVDLEIDSLDKKALGGSETWLMQISKEFAKEYSVDVYCNTQAQTSEGNLNFLPINNIVIDFSNGLKKYDFIILNRVIYKYSLNFIALIKQYYVTDSVFIQMHDLSFSDNYKLFDDDYLYKNLISDPVVKGIITLNEWHKINTLKQYPSIRNIYCIPNGIRVEDFKISNKKDNRILWSSCQERGLDILLKYIYPIVKKEISDFGVDVTGYNDIDDRSLFYDKDVKWLGKLNKKQLYEQSSKHKVWFYPGVFAETFCITLLENILSGAYPVTPFTYGMKDTVGEDLANILWNSNSNFEIENSESFNNAVNIASQKIINILKDPNYTIDENLVDKAKQYTWDNVVSKYIDLYNTTKDIQYQYEGVFLTMSANTGFYKQALKNVEETWAADLITGKYPSYTFYAYTSCDEQHPYPCIDKHMIYVDTPDDINHTYSKTKQALLLLEQHGITYKYLYRTNTSVYVNVPNIINNFKLSKNDIVGNIAGYYLKTDDDIKFMFDFISGIFWGMHECIIKKVFFNNYDESIDLNYLDGDDIVMSKIIKQINLSYNIIPINSNSIPGYIRYKCCIKEDYNNFKDFHKLDQYYSDDPNIVCGNNVIQVRSLYLGAERITKGYEFEHMRELHEAFIKNKENQ